MSENKKSVTRDDGAPLEVASAVNLFAHPVASAAAWSAFGFGMASHAFGFWMGAVAGASSAAQRLLEQGATPDPKAKVRGEQATGNVVLLARRQVATRQKEDVSPSAAKAAEVPASAQAALAAGDDLKAIAGIGPKLAQTLNGLGVRSYAQISAWTDEEIASIEEKLGLAGRIARDDWVGQATALAQAGSRQ